MRDRSRIHCPWCGAPTPMDYVHGHAQCSHCKTNIAPCCDGAVACAESEVGALSSMAEG